MKMVVSQPKKDKRYENNLDVENSRLWKLYKNTGVPSGLPGGFIYNTSIEKRQR